MAFFQPLVLHRSRICSFGENLSDIRKLGMAPAVWVPGRAYAILAPGEGWTEVHSAEVSNSGWVMSEGEWRATFARELRLAGPSPF